MVEESQSPTPALSKSSWADLWRLEDWWAVWIGLGVLGLLCAVILPGVRRDQLEAVREAKADLSSAEAAFRQAQDEPSARERARQLLTDARQKHRKAVEALAVPNLFRGWIARPGRWKQNPLDAFYKPGRMDPLRGIIGVFLFSLVVFGLGLTAMGNRPLRFAAGFAVVFFLATFAYLLAGQETVRQYNLEYALWALAVGLLVSNTIGTPRWVMPAVQTEFYIKTGLVLLGAEILLGRLLTLGVPGICVAWIVTPTVLITTFWFGQRILRIESRTLNMTLSADMSVCGVSAAIATAAACRAKKEELSLAIGISLTFTVIMMVVLPAAIRAVGMDEVLGGAWLGGTIDATGAVAAAGSLLGERALQVAATVKMIQNILIGVIAFFVALYWVTRVERGQSDRRPSLGEIWHRFPKFVIGFVAASAVFSWLYGSFSDPDAANVVVSKTIIGGVTKTLRGWFFCLAFVSIGLATNFRALAVHLRGGKPLVLYICGQSLNLLLTLLMAWLMFVKLFPDAAAILEK